MTDNPLGPIKPQNLAEVQHLVAVARMYARLAPLSSRWWGEFLRAVDGQGIEKNVFLSAHFAKDEIAGHPHATYLRHVMQLAVDFVHNPRPFPAGPTCSGEMSGPHAQPLLDKMLELGWSATITPKT